MECVNTALTSGADVNMTEKYTERTPLIVAVMINSIECIDKLLEMGADVNIVDCTKKTALLYAVEGKKCNVNMITRLVEAGADVNHNDATGRTVLMHAVDNTYVKCDTVNVLFNKQAGVKNERADVNNTGTCVNNQDEEGATPLILAAKRGHHEFMEILLHSGG